MQKRIEIALIFALIVLLRNFAREDGSDDVSIRLVVLAHSRMVLATVPDRVRSLELARYVFVRAGLSAPLLLLCAMRDLHLHLNSI